MGTFLSLLRVRLSVVFVLFWAGWIGLGGLALGQSMVARPMQRLLPGALPTVSVATLRIPEKAWTHFERARNAMLANRIEEYERESAKALEIAPEFAEVYLLRAIHAVSTQHFDTAIADVVAAQRIQPGVSWAAVILAGAYNGAHRWKDAAVILANMHGAEADTWQTKYEQARAAIGGGDVESALRWSAVAVAIAPESCAQVHLLRANALSLARRWPAAIAEIETYLGFDIPQPHRAEVAALLERTQNLARGEAGESMASR